MDKETLANLRRDYSSRQLSRSSVARDPFTQFGNWMAEALNSQVLDASALVQAHVEPAGAVDKDIDATDVAGEVCGERAHGRIDREVDGVDTNFPRDLARAFGNGLQRAGVSPKEANSRAGGRELQTSGTTDIAARP